MRSVRYAFTLVLGAGLVCTPLAAQMVVSAKSGLVHYVEGDVVLGDDLINPKIGHFPDMKEGQVLRTEAGRAVGHTGALREAQRLASRVRCCG